MTVRKIELEEELDRVFDTLEDIYDEADSDDPDVDRIRALAADSLGIDEESEEDENNID
jgi:uncharacterized protein (UPF0335 family)